MAVEPEDPGDYRGGLFDHIDVPALVSLVFCAVGFLLLVILVRPKYEEASAQGPQLDELSERMARILMPLRTPETGFKLHKPPPLPKPGGAAAEKSRSALSSIENSRRRLQAQLREVSARVSHTAVLSILSSKNTGGRSGRHVAGGGSLAFGDLNQRLSSLDGLTRFDDRGNAAGAASGHKDDGAEMADADPLMQKFATAKKSAAAKIGSFEFERPQLLGGVAKQAAGKQLQMLSSYITRNQTSIRLLYEERLKMNPALEGKVTVVLVIEGSGRVSSARIIPGETTLQDAEFQEEIIRSLLRWVFPSFPGGPVEVKSPFVFKPL